MKESEKIALRKRCDNLIKQTKPRKVNKFSDSSVYSVMKVLNMGVIVPRITMSGRKREKGRGIIKVFKTYLKILIEESLKHPIDIYIYRVGILRVREINSIGQKRIWNEDGKTKFRMDTPFDAKVMYRIYHKIFGLEECDFRTPFRLSRVFISPILGKIYKLHPEGKYYLKYIKKRN